MRGAEEGAGVCGAGPQAWGMYRRLEICGVGVGSSGPNRWEFGHFVLVFGLEER